jgi:PAS domain S-box-containing protein
MNDGVTALDRTTRALQDSETRLQQVLDNTSALVFAKDSQGRYLFVNREFERITGRTSGEILGRTDEAVFPADLAVRFRHNDLRVLREERAIEFEEVADFGDGPRTFLSSKFPLLDAEGRTYGVCGIATDITERRRAVEALRDSEAQYRAIFNASEDALILWDSQMRRVDVNAAHERIYGWAREDVLGRGYDGSDAPADYARPRQAIIRRALAGETVRAELDAVRKDGEHILTEVVAIPFRHRGEPHVLAIARDVTERKRLEEALSSAALAVSEAEGEALFRELARYLAAILRVDAVFISTADPADPAQMQVRAMHLDGKVLENFSYGLAGTPCATVFGQQFRFYPSHLAELFPLDADFRALGFQGYAGHPLTDSAGRPVGLLAVVARRPLENPAFVESVLRIFSVRVVAELERVAARDALLASEASYREIFEASEDAIFVHDWDTGAIVDANPQACRAYGYSREELLKVRLADLSSGTPPYTEEHGLQWIEAAKRDGSARFEWHRRNRDGSLHWDEVRLKAAHIGGQQRVLAISRDVTEAKRTAEEHTALEARLRQAKKMEAIGQLTGGIAHDFNNLLTSILGYVTLAGEREPALADPRLGGYLAQARRSCERARDLIQQMLMFSRGQRGTPRIVALASQARQALEAVRPLLGSDLVLELALDDAAPPVCVDPLQFEQVLLNLCVNARDAIDGSGRVRVAVRHARVRGVACASCRGAPDGEFVELVVEDTGQGIAPEVLERIFEPFFSTKETGKGTGMGLAMVHGLVHEHGGHVLVESQPGRGSSFRVLWPAAPAATPAAAMPSPGSRSDASGWRPALSGSVLIVDDESVVGEFMRELLETWGMDASFVAGPQAALELVSEAPARFDAVITDQAMPHMTGLQLARALHGVRGDLPVLVYSGYGDGLAREDLEAAGVRTVLRKPVEPAALEAALRAVLK